MRHAAFPGQNGAVRYKSRKVVFAEGFPDKLLVIREGRYLIQVLFHAGLYAETFLGQIRKLTEKNLGQFFRGDGAPEGGEAHFNPRFNRLFADVHGGGFQNFLSYPAGCHKPALAGTFRGSAVPVSESPVQTAEQIILHRDSAVFCLKILSWYISMIPIYNPYPGRCCKGISLHMVDAEAVDPEIILPFQNFIGLIAFVVNLP